MCMGNSCINYNHNCVKRAQKGKPKMRFLKTGRYSIQVNLYLLYIAYKRLFYTGGLQDWFNAVLRQLNVFRYFTIVVYAYWSFVTIMSTFRDITKTCLYNLDPL